MKFIVAAVLLCAAVASATELYKSTPFSEEEAESYFNWYMNKFRPQGYENKAEQQTRYTIFKSNMEFVRQHNQKFLAGEVTFTTGLNELSDLSFTEYRQKYLRPMNRTRAPRVGTFPKSVTLSGQADSVDWRQQGAVTPVKNQGQCGSCWSFSTTGSVEGASAIKFGKLVSLSEQQLMDCSTAEGDHSCQGGLMDFAFEYIEKNGGVDSESDYPYLARNEACKKSKENTHVANVASYQDVPQGDEDALKSAVAAGPVSIAIEADQRAFQMYRSGVFTAECGTQLDHGVLAVGYGTESGTDYWIVKNSWGESWGDNGYIMLERGVNKCGLANAASQPKAAQPSSFSVSADNDYEDPKPNGCHSGEMAVRITGVSGDFCSPSCSQSSPCPAAPSGTTANPECVLETKPGNPTNCALICNPSADDSCPSGASCKAIQGTGVCTYDD